MATHYKVGTTSSAEGAAAEDVKELPKPVADPHGSLTSSDIAKALREAQKEVIAEQTKVCVCGRVRALTC